MSLPAAPPKPPRDRLTLLCVALLLTFAGLGDTQLSGSEGRWATIEQEMLRSGQWHLPVINGYEYADKPLLSYWLGGLLAAISGGVSEFTIRAPGAIAWIATAFLLWRIGRRSGDRRVAMGAPLIFLLLGWPLHIARTAAADAPMIFAVVLAWWAITARMSHATRSRAVSSPLRAALLGAVIGAAIHLKGPLAFVLPAIGVAGALAFNRWLTPTLPEAPREPLGLAMLNGLKRHAVEIVVLVLFAAGVAEATLQWSESHSGSQQVRAYLWRESVTRAADPFDHTGSPLLYAWVLPVMLLPVLAMAPLWALGAAPVDPNARR
jgi:4-amino-4-deoxy-L-arabinose transferase-like glycosyltransferase